MTALIPAQGPEKLPLSAMLRLLAADMSRKRISVGDLLTVLGDRALGALMFVFAVPNVLPAPPGTSAILGLPLLFLAAQVTLARRPWLPAIITRRSMSREDFHQLIRRIAPWLERAEKLLRPRFSFLALPPLEQCIGLICLLLAVILALPIPLGNMLPALAISLMALGLVERDGLWIGFGLLMAGVAVVVVSGVVFALVKAALFFFTQILS